MRVVAIIGVDLLAQILAIAAVIGIQFGAVTTASIASMSLLAAALPVGWVVILALTGGYKAGLLSSRHGELRHVFRSALYAAAIGCIAFNSFASGVSQLTVFATVGIALLLMILGRLQIRRIVARAWRADAATTGVVLVGSLASVLDSATRMSESPDSGLRVVGLCVSTPEFEDRESMRPMALPDSYPIASDADLLHIVTEHNAGMVIVTSPGTLGANRIREIAWMLESTDAELMLSTGLGQVADHRMRLQRIGGGSFVSVDQPRYTGVRRVALDIGERAIAALGLIVLSPIIGAIALAVRLDSKGKAFFVQTRVGRGGKTFRMFKFRSMVTDAEVLRDAVVAAENEPDRGPMFKSRNDPRVTRIGRLLRKSSLDELPQLLNVVSGSMALVGPRPALPDEVAQYKGPEIRRLLVKPGITGLWQVSGRSNLSWEQTVNLDLEYVENWSPVMDLSIMSRTLGAVTRSAGAY
ncbi:exopolysaccharide biosynthesis polyprenyl glycosylphosphotransferase [Antricoccus suffuscus]|uniref:Exopolysaccharide biosynthesis polyprenyl glycosylphosphotransferase n=1 Tax=Antricoccus suffuscus TaxID=1629062 RepID=A0A2T0ZWI0_9ACTN|nr:exopolysaccharide biosynthesis polyprenyl glycosylphosphotransferase [Antricoccus suffuscus]